MKISKGLLFLPRLLLSRGMRGGTRLTQFLADRFSGFRSYRASVPGGELFVDLRNPAGQSYLHSVPLSGEHRILGQCIRPGDVAFDIGANVGLYTVWLSSLTGPSGKVFAFEPNPAHQKGLAKTAGSLTNTTVLNVGLSDHEGSFELFVPEDDTMASLADWTEEQAGEVRKVSCMVTTIDALVEGGQLPRPDLIKCDIEGGELNCFRGGAVTLNSVDAPVMLFEANINSTRGFGNTISSGMNYLAQLDKPGYKFFLVDDDASVKAIESIDFLHGNILAVPASRSDLLVHLPNA